MAQYHILVVDDDKEIVDSISIFLQNDGYYVIKAYDGMEAMERLNDNEVHLILLDVMMPKMDGIKALLKIREKRNIPVILVSAKSEDTDKKELTVDEEAIKLTPIEYKIVELFMNNLGRVFSIDEIYEKVWNEPSFNADNVVAVHIRRIREKIEINPKEPKYLKVVWGIGYKIDKNQ